MIEVPTAGELRTQNAQKTVLALAKVDEIIAGAIVKANSYLNLATTVSVDEIDDEIRKQLLPGIALNDTCGLFSCNNFNKHFCERMCALTEKGYLVVDIEWEDKTFISWAKDWGAENVATMIEAAHTHLTGEMLPRKKIRATIYHYCGAKHYCYEDRSVTEIDE